MAFDIKEFLLAVVAVIVGAYILNYLGILKHSSPASARIGNTRPFATGMRSGSKRGYSNVAPPVPVATSITPPTVSRGTRVANNVGPTEPTKGNMSKGIGVRSFVT
jgi:hypothetical protein